MSYEDDESGSEYANGGANRFDGLEQAYTKGGVPRALPDTFHEARNTLRSFMNVDFTPMAANFSTVELCREFKAVKDAKEAADVIAKELNRRYDFLRLAMIPKRFEDEGLSNIKVDGVGRVQLASDLYAAILPGMKPKAYEWLDDNGRGDIVQKTVNASTLKATLKKMIVNGEEYPAELFKAEPFTRASIVKA
jgi:hypothetical protein